MGPLQEVSGCNGVVSKARAVITVVPEIVIGVLAAARVAEEETLPPVIRGSLPSVV